MTAEPRCCWAWEYHGPILTQPKSCVAKPWSTSPSNPGKQFTAGLGSDPSGHYAICKVISGLYPKYLCFFFIILLFSFPCLSFFPCKLLLGWLAAWACLATFAFTASFPTQGKLSCCFGAICTLITALMETSVIV